MSWYNPLSWFGKNESDGRDLTLYCDGPRCKLPIEDETVDYSVGRREVYHPFPLSCVVSATAHRAFDSRGIVIERYSVIGRREAMRLLRKGRLAQSALENRAD